MFDRGQPVRTTQPLGRAGGGRHQHLAAAVGEPDNGAHVGAVQLDGANPCVRRQGDPEREPRANSCIDDVVYVVARCIAVTPTVPAPTRMFEAAM